MFCMLSWILGCRALVLLLAFHLKTDLKTVSFTSVNRVTWDLDDVQRMRKIIPAQLVHLNRVYRRHPNTPDDG